MINDIRIIYYHPYLIKYIGYIKNEKYDGYGKLYHRNGKLFYEGNFKDHLFNGYGIKYDENGNILYNGLFYKGFSIFM